MQSSGTRNWHERKKRLGNIQNSDGLLGKMPEEEQKTKNIGEGENGVDVSTGPCVFVASLDAVCLE